MKTTTHKQYTLDTTLRKNGLPYLVPFARWHINLLGRTTAVFSYLCIVNLTLGLALIAADHIQHTQLSPQLQVALSTTTLLISLLLPLPFTKAVLRHFKTLGRYAKSSVSIVAVLGYCISSIFLSVILSIIFRDITAPEDSLQGIIDSISGPAFIIATVFLLEYTGLLPILSWAMRTIGRQITNVGGVAARAVPIIFMIVIFSFFAADTWQIIAAASGRIGALFVFVLLMIGVALLVTVQVARGQLRDSWRPFKKLSALGKANVFFVIIATQLVQATLFFVAFMSILLVLGYLLIPVSLLNTWLTNAAVEQIILYGRPLPITIYHIHSSLFISTFATVSFMIASATDTDYKDQLFDPIIRKIQLLIARRDV